MRTRCQLLRMFVWAGAEAPTLTPGCLTEGGFLCGVSGLGLQILDGSPGDQVVMHWSRRLMGPSVLQTGSSSLIVF